VRKLHERTLADCENFEDVLQTLKKTCDISVTGDEFICVIFVFLFLSQFTHQQGQMVQSWFGTGHVVFFDYFVYFPLFDSFLDNFLTTLSTFLFLTTFWRQLFDSCLGNTVCPRVVFGGSTKKIVVFCENFVYFLSRTACRVPLTKKNKTKPYRTCSRLFFTENLVTFFGQEFFWKKKHFFYFFFLRQSSNFVKIIGTFFFSSPFLRIFLARMYCFDHEKKLCRRRYKSTKERLNV
jgi:hypothetical protein